MKNRRRLSGVRGTRSTYDGMKQRCLNPRATGYVHYGARGIRICEQWLGVGGWESFLAHMGPRPEGATIDRINNDGNYEPGNVRWASPRTQSLNVRPAEALRRREFCRGLQRSRNRLLGLRSLKIFGRVLGYGATEKLMREIREQLEAEMGPPAPMALPKTPFSIEDAFTAGDFRFESDHFDGLEHVSREFLRHGTWSQLTGQALEFDGNGELIEEAA